MEEKDFIKIRKDKQKEFKKQLDKEQKKKVKLEMFGGMTDNEILMNKHKFEELGLL